VASKAISGPDLQQPCREQQCPLYDTISPYAVVTATAGNLTTGARMASQFCTNRSSRSLMVAACWPDTLAASSVMARWCVSAMMACRVPTAYTAQHARGPRSHSWAMERKARDLLADTGQDRARQERTNSAAVATSDGFSARRPRKTAANRSPVPVYRPFILGNLIAKTAGSCAASPSCTELPSRISDDGSSMSGILVTVCEPGRSQRSHVATVQNAA
jgi:hypothetical protein